MTLIKDLIDVPEAVHKGDFVLRLTEGVQHADQTLDSYVVTPELVRNFEEALTFIRSAIDSNDSKATYLDGSFGSGKSHFMAVLHLLLQGHPKARAIPELAPAVAKHAGWMDGKRILLVPYHMIGARSMEAAILGNYADYVRRLHPDASLPGVYIAESLFRDATTVRKRMGDEAFFAELNEGKDAGGGWGEMERSWDADSFQAAVDGGPDSPEQSRLVGDLVSTLFTSYAEAMQGQGAAYIPLDRGLSVLSRHARDLGYDAMVLFLDELILWLASHAADARFVREEIQKVAKLVEAQHADRPVPIVSFVARQRDLRELIGAHAPGSEQLAFADMLKWWEGRLHKIGLLDRNLPAIAEKRVLKPKSEAARRQLDTAFAESTRVRREVMDTLLTAQADRKMFRQVYPFSPALVATLVAVSSVLQRERTAIKVMMQLLVNQRERLALGDIVPVGDLFDVIAEGDEAFSEGMRQHFENAKRLYHQKLLPLLEKGHGMRREEAAALPPEDPKAVAFRADDRLVKTLLLSALAPEVEPLKALTAQRLAALNHGSIRSPIPGREGQMVLSKVRRWAAAVGEIKIGDESVNPTISLQLSGVDTESIIEKARVADNPGERQRKVREMVFDALGIEERDELFLTHSFPWRNTKRTCDVIFANVRELPDESLRGKEDRWKVVIDFPFDEQGHTPKDDLARLQKYRDENDPTLTLVWMPAFFSREAQRDLGLLVILDHVLAGERFNDYASHLMQADRAAARSLLDNRRSQLRERIRLYLEGAYGVAAPPQGALDESLDPGEHVQSLDPTFQPRLPVGNDLGQALQHLLDQMLSHQYPAHPHFRVEAKLPVIKKVLAELQREPDETGRRIHIEKTVRPLVEGIAVPLELGELGSTHFVPGNRWAQHFQRKLGQDGGPLTVAKLRRWMNDPDPRGLTAWVQNLLILDFAEREGYSFKLHGGPAGKVGLDSIANELVLERVDLPPKVEWETATKRVAPILGYQPATLLNAANVARFADDVQAQVREHRADCEDLCRKLAARMKACGLDPMATPRLKTANAVLALVEAVRLAGAPTAVVDTVARAQIATSETAMGASLKKAGAVCGGLDSINWEVFDAVGKLQDARAEQAGAIVARVKDVLAADEYASALIPALQKAQSEALQTFIPPEPPPAPPPPPPPPGSRIVQKGNEKNLSSERSTEVLRGIEQKLGEKAGRKLDVSWTIREER